MPPTQPFPLVPQVQTGSGWGARTVAGTSMPPLRGEAVDESVQIEFWGSVTRLSHKSHPASQWVVIAMALAQGLDRSWQPGDLP